MRMSGSGYRANIVGTTGRSTGLILVVFSGCDLRGLNARAGCAVIGPHLEGSPNLRTSSAIKAATENLKD